MYQKGVLLTGLQASNLSPVDRAGLWPNSAVAGQELKPRHAPCVKLDRLLQRGIIGSVLHLKLLKILEPHLLDREMQNLFSDIG